MIGDVGKRSVIKMLSHLKQAVLEEVIWDVIEMLLQEDMTTERGSNSGMKMTPHLKDFKGNWG